MRWRTPRIPNHPVYLLNVVGPRNMIHSFATDTDDPTVEPRWGKVGKQRIEDAGTLYPDRMETVDEEYPRQGSGLPRQGAGREQAVLPVAESTRMHVVTYFSDKYEGMRDSENGWSMEEAGMAQLDDIVGSVRFPQTKASGEHHLVFTTDNGAENFTWPDGGQTPFAGGKGMVAGRRLPRAVYRPLAGHVPRARSRTHLVGLTGFRRSSRRRGIRTSSQELRRERRLVERSSVHLDGYDQTALLTGQGPTAREEVFYFTESTLAAVRLGDFKYRFTDQPDGWLGRTVKVDWPMIVNLRLDPFERMGMPEPRRHGLSRLLRLVLHRVLALRLRPAGSRQRGAELRRIPADAARREVQHGSGEGAD